MIRVLKDSEILDLFYARSGQAIAALSEKYGAICRKAAWNILQNDQDAEECVNDAYLAAWNTIPPQKPDRLLAYVCRIVRNHAVKRYHANTAQKRNHHYDLALDELEACLCTQETPETALSVQELSRLLDCFLSTLERADRVLFVRRYWYADSVSALAASLGISANSASVRLSRIREKLRKYLRKEGYWL